MTGASKYHLSKGTSADGPHDLAITPESAGWTYSGLRVLPLRPGEEHALSTGENEFLVLPLNGGCTVAVDGRSFELGGWTDVFSAVTDFAYLPRESQAVISSADGGTYALPSARTEQGGHSARYGRKEDVPVELRGAGACSWWRHGADPHGRHGPSIAAPGYDLYCLDVMAGPGQDRAPLICDDPARGWVRDTWASQDVDDRLRIGEHR
ncbi:5-deoxy-glucuronate isomerase [Streptomyces sp. NPDC050759]|uniref:5-deoxy-glucuronate isomerase n=1 Tax=Streptomyces sp. NPDC050759 TaxID=3365635 RepID=UPI00378F9D46